MPALMGFPKKCSDTCPMSFSRLMLLGGGVENSILEWARRNCTDFYLAPLLTNSNLPKLMGSDTLGGPWVFLVNVTREYHMGIK